MTPPLPYPPGRWEPASVDASTRRYFRGTWEGNPALLADFGDDLDSRERFLFTSAHLTAGGVRVPRILEAPAGAPWVVQERVGGPPLSSLPLRGPLRARVLGIARDISALPPWGGEGPELLALDGPRLRFELSFFREHFLGAFLNRADAGEAREALADLADRVAQIPRTLCHRDFHSENLLLHPSGEPVVIDHQDALLGPAGYDAASLAVEAYRPADPALYAEIRREWMDLDPSSAESFDLVALQRALKALGTFGYQITRRKRARYLSSLGPAASHALRLLPAGPPGLGLLRTALQGVLS